MKFEIVEFSCPSAGNLLRGEACVPESPGKHPALILSHGFNVGLRHFQRLATFFAGKGYVSCSFDFAGGSVTSRSEGRSTEMSVFTERQNLLDVLEAVRGWDCVDPEAVFLLGESLGGSVTAITAPLVAHQIRGIILAFPAFCVPADGYAQFPALEDIPEQFEMMGMTIGREYLLPFYQGYDFYQEIGNYHGPVLLIHGTEDPLVAPSYSIRAHKLYSDSRLCWIDGAGHGFYAPEQRELYYSYISSFLQEFSPSGKSA
jgi:hypothetical protein